MLQQLIQYGVAEDTGNGTAEVQWHPAGAITRLPNAHPDIATKSCGACTECCTVIDGDFRPLLAEYKPANTPCPMLFSKESGMTGCRAYAQRPQCCQTFKCWALLLVQMDESQRYRDIARELARFGKRTYREELAA